MSAGQESGSLTATSLASIYFAERGPYIKIGISRFPERRVRALRFGAHWNGAPRDAERGVVARIIYTIPNSTLADESAMQARFNAWHVTGEWFRPDPGFYAELDAVRLDIDGPTDARNAAILRMLQDALTTAKEA